MDKLFRNLPAFKGKGRLARFFLKSDIKNKNDVNVIGRYGVNYLLPNLVESIGFDIFINGEYEPEIQDLILKLLPANGCFLDLGGNIGAIVIPVAKRRPDIKAISVEAAPWIFKYLLANLQTNNLENVQLVNYALFDEDNLELDFFSPLDKYGKGSLASVFTNEKIKVRSIKVDTLVKKLAIEKVDLIKIDIEGFEYFAFNGALDMLSSSSAPVLIFEFIDWAEALANSLKPGDAQRLLIELGYTLYEVRGRNIIKMDSYFTTGAYNLVASKREMSFLHKI